MSKWKGCPDEQWRVVRFSGSIEIAEEGDGVVERGRGTTADAPLAIGFRERERVEKVGMGLEPLARPVAE
jgi:hypothetical protein